MNAYPIPHCQRSRCKPAVLAALCFALLAGVAGASEVQQLVRASALIATNVEPPAADRDWAEVTLPRSWADSDLPGPHDAVWIRAEFDHPQPRAVNNAWAVYLPYLFAGGDVWLNGSLIGQVHESDNEFRVHWQQPFVFRLPPSLLRPGRNDLAIRTGVDAESASVHVATMAVGREIDLLAAYESRLFWARIMPHVTVVVCLLVSGFVLFIWWRRRSEVLYGLFGLAAALWGLRTCTFIVDALPASWWSIWRLLVMGTTVGFVVLLAIFNFRLTRVRAAWIERALLAYWAVGVACMLVLNADAGPLISKIWSGGLLPVGAMIFAVALWSVWRERTALSAVMPTALGFALLAGLHDYFTFYQPQVVGYFFPQWAGYRFFLLHHAANVLLIAMGGLMAVRFIQAVSGLEDLNRTLESRVADRERKLAANYGELAALQRERAAAEERQLIMRDLHDGLGSQLFTSLARAERGDMDSRQIAVALRECIADMRLALDALASQNKDVGAAVADFMFRWEAQLTAAGVQPRWEIDLGDGELNLPPHGALQLLRVAQEALTNVLKHAEASQVEVRLKKVDAVLELRIVDDGRGLQGHPTNQSRGLVNMHSRAQRLGGVLDVQSNGHGTSVVLSVPVNAQPARGVSRRMTSRENGMRMRSSEAVAGVV